MLAFGVMMFGATATGETTCEAHKKSVLEDIENSGGGVGFYIPQCTQNGDYEPKQCDITWMCWCVNEGGVEVPFSRPEEETGTTNFPCETVRSVDDTECAEEAIKCMVDRFCPALVGEWRSDEGEETTAACNENIFCKTWLECYEREIARRRATDNDEEENHVEHGCASEVEECWLDEECQMVLDGFRQGEELECWYHAACTKAFSCYAEQNDCDEPCAYEALACAIDTECSPWVHTVDDEVKETDDAWNDCLGMEKCNALLQCAAWDGPNATPVAPIKAAMKNHLKMATASMLRSCPSCQY